MHALKQLGALVCLSLANAGIAYAAEPTRPDRLTLLKDQVVYIFEDKRAIQETPEGAVELWRRKLPEGEPEPVLVRNFGTGFLIARGNEPFIVTAAHVARQLSRRSRFVFHGDADTPIEFGFSELTLRCPDIKWCPHTSADVAVLAISPGETTLHQLRQRFLPTTFLSEELKAPDPHRELTVLGFPLGLGVGGFMSPLHLRSRAASGLLTLSNVQGAAGEETYFALEDPSIAGYSGAPVFDLAEQRTGFMVMTGGDLRILGIMTGTMKDDTGGKLALVVPAKKILEVLDLAAAMKPAKCP